MDRPKHLGDLANQTLKDWQICEWWEAIKDDSFGDTSYTHLGYYTRKELASARAKQEVSDTFPAHPYVSPVKHLVLVNLAIPPGGFLLTPMEGGHPWIEAEDPESAKTKLKDAALSKLTAEERALLGI